MPIFPNHVTFSATLIVRFPHSPMDNTLTIRPPVWALLLAVVIGGGFYVYGKTIETRDKMTPATISVSGEGKVSGTPDIGLLTLGVQTGRKTTAKEASASLSKSMNAVFDAVQKAGIDKKDITTEQFSLNPSYDWTTGTQTLKGYEATESLQVKVRNLDTISDVLGAATNAGANQAGDVSFTIDDPEKLRAQARSAAISQAKQKAQTLAQELGMSLGKITAFTEGGNVQPPVPIYRNEAMMAVGGAADKSAPLPSGQQDIVSDVTITYELQ